MQFKADVCILEEYGRQGQGFDLVVPGDCRPPEMQALLWNRIKVQFTTAGVAFKGVGKQRL